MRGRYNNFDGQWVRDNFFVSGSEVLKSDGTKAGRQDKDGYFRISHSGKSTGAHRIAWFLFYGFWPDRDIDHINGDKEDNSKANLRLVSPEQNSKNMKISKRNTSGRVGVYWNKRKKKWSAAASKNKKEIHLGYFPTKQEAILARIRAEGEFGYSKSQRRFK